MATVKTDGGTTTINNHPDQCPFCHHKITPINLFGFNNNNYTFDVMQLCPNSSCQKTFISIYTNSSRQFTGQTTQGTLVGKDFSATINEISTSFTTIYNQAFCAEQQNLTEICGVGYRKALEFLIKDYLIKKNPSNATIIENKFLGPCINDLVNDTRIQSVAKRAVWLGNDETHYVRKWEGKNLEDLKKLIELTVHWIEMETLTETFEEEMPG